MLRLYLSAERIITSFCRGYDDDFSKLFKIRADFDYEMDRSDENIYKIAGFISRFSKNEKTVPFDSSAVAAVIEYSSRIVESQKKMSTRFNLIARNTGGIGNMGGRWTMRRSLLPNMLKKAEAGKGYRLAMYQEKMNELLDDGTVMIATDGKCVGKINGLAVLDMGDYAFGSPTG